MSWPAVAKAESWKDWSWASVNIAVEGEGGGTLSELLDIGPEGHST
jgi:hypothetical protein